MAQKTAMSRLKAFWTPRLVSRRHISGAPSRTGASWLQASLIAENQQRRDIQTCLPFDDEPSSC